MLESRPGDTSGELLVAGRTERAAMQTVLDLRFVVGLLVVLGGLGLVGCVAAWSGVRPLPARPNEPDRSGSPARTAATVIAVALQREGAGGLGRHDERRCGF
jgi:hypothetical protein